MKFYLICNYTILNDKTWRILCQMYFKLFAFACLYETFIASTDEMKSIPNKNALDLRWLNWTELKMKYGSSLSFI